MPNPTVDVERDAEPAPAAQSARRLLTPRWIAFTVLVVAAVCAFLFLAWWQLDRFESSTGSWQNLGYTLQWPFFAAFAVYLWWKLLRDPESVPDDPSQDAIRQASGDDAVALPGAERGARSPAVTATDDGLLPPLPPKRRTGDTRTCDTRTGDTRTGETGSLDAVPVDAQDADLAAYNRYLSALHRRTRSSA